MDTSEYLPLFIAECRENLEELTNAIVRLEEEPGDRETLDSVFRIAHSLKGMAGTMGFGAMAKLTHQMEDVLELLRQRDAGLPHEATDVLLACLDLLTAGVDGIEADGQENIDPRELIDKLAVLVRGRDEPREVAAAPVAQAPPAGGVRVTLAPQTLMPSVRAFQILSTLGDLAEVRSSSPRLDEVDTFKGNEIIADVVCAEPEELELALRRITDVATVAVADTGPPEQGAADQGAQLKVVAPATPESKPKPAKPADTRTSPTVRVDAERLDQLMHLLGEAAFKRTRVEALISGLEIPELRLAMDDLKATSRELQQTIMLVRMISVDTVFARFPRLVRDVSAKLGKTVELTLTGQDTELDRTVVDAIGDPLVHLIRNALDHGIETPEERVAAGKPAEGKLRISARHASGSIVISVTDDGRGVVPEMVARHAAERGLIAPHEVAMIDVGAAIEMLFKPGFSTSGAVDDVSGRGVGMDAVRNRVRKLGGEIAVSSTPGQGTIAEVRLPLTLAIMQALVAEIGATPYGFQMARVRRTMVLSEQTIRSVGGEPILLLENESVPLLRGAEVFGHGEGDHDTHVIIIDGHDGTVAVTVSGLIGQRELVTRPLPAAFSDSEVLSSAAVLPNGDIVLLTDCDSLVNLSITQKTGASASAA